MTNQSLNTTFHANLSTLADTPTGFSASDVTGYSPEQVRRAAEAMAGAGMIVRCKVSPRRVRYFKTDEQARAFMAGKVSGASPRMAGGPRVKAPWKPEDPGLITPNTKIYIAPPLPRQVFKTNTYWQF
jgi:hypothetical protein